jgi:hypothetical protein
VQDVITSIPNLPDAIDAADVIAFPAVVVTAPTVVLALGLDEVV